MDGVKQRRNCALAADRRGHGNQRQREEWLDLSEGLQENLEGAKNKTFFFFFFLTGACLRQLFGREASRVFEAPLTVVNTRSGPIFSTMAWAF